MWPTLGVEGAVKKLTEYLERAVQLEDLAAKEPDSAFKEQLLAQARAYRKLASKWAEDLGMPPPSPKAK
jgi:predicted ABC-class ATPase